MEETLTPKPNKTVTMDFYEALKKVIEGKKIARESWNNGDYGLLKDGFISIYTKGDFHTWSISDGDCEGRDWFIKNVND